MRINKYEEFNCEEGSKLSAPQSHYFQKEVPNVKITLHNEYTKENTSFYCDTVKSFYEEISNDVPGAYSKAILVSAALSPKTMALLSDACIHSYKLETEEIWRDEKGKDHFYYGPTRIYHHMKLRYQRSADGENHDWYLIFYNDPINKDKPAEVNIHQEERLEDVVI